MDPNSRNQRWSKWTFTITPTRVKRPTFADVRTNAARFGRKAFGSASQMKIDVLADGAVRIMVRTEGHPVHDPRYVAWMIAQWRRWAIAGWGIGTRLKGEAKLEAGTREDGTPADQLIIAPPLSLH